MKDKKKELSGTKATFGGFEVEVDDKLNICIAHENGWMVRYPAHTPAWSVISSWLLEWSDEESREAFRMFISSIVYVTSMRLHDIDSQYLEGFIKLHGDLNNRIFEANKEG